MTSATETGTAAVSTTASESTTETTTATTEWRIDPARSEARFAASTLWGHVGVVGTLGEVSGTLTWDGTRGHGEMEIATEGVSSGIGLRDRHLRSGEYFDVKRHPAIRFRSAEARRARGARPFQQIS